MKLPNVYLMMGKNSKILVLMTFADLVKQMTKMFIRGSQCVSIH